MRVGIVGAGMAGLACADRLIESGCEVHLFDKGRGAGGRMSTRRIETANGEAAFDHGAQYFTVRDPQFLDLVTSWERSGLVARWPAAGPDAWVGVPAMNSVIKHMSERHAVKFGQLVKNLERRDGNWYFTLATGEAGPFDIAILAVPAEQAATIVSLHDFDMARIALQARSKPCWTGLFAFCDPVASSQSIVRDSGIIAWAARNSEKPGRDGPESWVVQAQPSWTETHYDDDPEAVSHALLDALEQVLGLPLPTPLATNTHRWRFAMSHGTGDRALLNDRTRIGICGDWLIGPRVEAAWQSGQELGERIASTIDACELKRRIA